MSLHISRYRYTPIRSWICHRSIYIHSSASYSTHRNNTSINASYNTTDRILVIVESPTKAVSIQKLVPYNYRVVSCAGHIRDIASSSLLKHNDKYKSSAIIPELNLTVASIGIDVDNNFKPIYAVPDGKERVLQRLQNLSKNCTQILLATDEDREGEAISWHLQELLNPDVPVKRAVFREITKSAIIDSFSNPRELDMSLVHAQEARAVLDKLVGFTVSRVLWRYLSRGISAGRVQSRGLKLIIEREQKRWKFVPSTFYSIEASFSTTSDVCMQATVVSLGGRRIAGSTDFDSESGDLKTTTLAANSIVLDELKTKRSLQWLCSQHVSFRVSNITRSTIYRSPPPAFITSTLQQEGSRRLGLSPSHTMRIAHKLYEEGYITYMRTDSPVLSAPAKSAAVNTINRNFSSEFVLSDVDTIGTKGTPKNSQEAHETGLSPSHTMLIARKLYEEGYITYMRTDSPVLSAPAKSAAVNTINRNFSSEFVLSDVDAIGTKGTPKNSQEAHEAIRPACPSDINGSHLLPDETELKGLEKAMYELILKRTIASLMPPSKSITTTVTVKATSDEPLSLGDDSIYDVELKASSTEIVFRGYLAVSDLGVDYPDKSSEPMTSVTNNVEIGTNLTLCATSSQDDTTAVNDSSAVVGTVEPDSDTECDDSPGVEVLSHSGARGVKHETNPPRRYTVSSFIRELELAGIGRPSTYATIFDTLKTRGYVTMDGRVLLPTARGIATSALISKLFPDLVAPEFTSSMESALDNISKGGEADKLRFLSSFFLGDESESEKNLGLKSRVAAALVFDEQDLSDVHVIDIPDIKSIGKVYYGKRGLEFESNTVMDENNMPKRWKLPRSMENDIREVNVESIRNIIENGISFSGDKRRICLETGQPIVIRNGRFGKFVTVGNQDDPSRRTGSLPAWVNEATPLRTVLDFIGLPRVLFTHPSLNVPVSLCVTRGALAVQAEGYRAVALPGFILPSEVTSEIAMEYLSKESLQESGGRMLGEWKGNPVYVKCGPYGYYVMCGRKKRALKTSNCTLEEAISHLQSSSRKTKVASTTGKDKNDGNSKKTLSNYQAFVRHMLERTENSI